MDDLCATLLSIKLSIDKVDKKITEYDNRILNIEKYIIDIHTKLNAISIENKEQLLEIFDKTNESIGKINYTLVKSEEIVDKANKNVDQITTKVNNTVEALEIKLDDTLDDVNGLLTVVKNPLRLFYSSASRPNKKVLPAVTYEEEDEDY